MLEPAKNKGRPQEEAARRGKRDLVEEFCKTPIGQEEAKRLNDAGLAIVIRDSVLADILMIAPSGYPKLPILTITPKEAIHLIGLEEKEAKRVIAFREKFEGEIVVSTSCWTFEEDL